MDLLRDMRMRFLMSPLQLMYILSSAKEEGKQAKLYIEVPGLQAEMASSALNTKSHFHVRSNSLPSRPHPLVSQIEERLCRLRATETTSSSICNNINGLSDLYDLVNNLLMLPLTQVVLARECHDKLVDEVLDWSLRVMDVCGTTKDSLLRIKEDTQALQSTLRRRRGDDSKLANEVGEYMNSWKKSNKLIQKSLRDLKSSTVSSSDNENVAFITILREVEGVTFTVFESLLSCLSGEKAQSKQSRWSLVSKLMHTKRKTFEEEATEINEFEKVGAALYSLIGNKSRKSICLNAENAQNMLGKLEACIQVFEEELENLLRRLIKTRVSLLNILNH